MNTGAWGFQLQVFFLDWVFCKDCKISIYQKKNVTNDLTKG